MTIAASGIYRRVERFDRIASAAARSGRAGVDSMSRQFCAGAV
eukprot:COSAG02_NODE_40887_length_400_cov_0.983389_1_plen_42_part_01